MQSVKLSNIGQLVTYDTTQNKMVKLINHDIVIEDGKVYDIGHELGSADNIFDCSSMLVTPGFVDPHTHPVFLNYRESEFNLRLKGNSYEEIAKAGGGIINSIKDVRQTPKLDLINKVKNRMDTFLKLGTTTVECKSGYGLDLESEVKSLKVIRKVNEMHDIDMVPTFMGAHAFPPEYENDHNGYVDLICNEMLPEIAKQGLAKFNDVFCENGFFNIQQTERILNKGKKLGLFPRIHADEFEDSGAAKLASKLSVLSADHLMAVSLEGIQSMAENNIIGILLPGTTFFLGKSNYAPYKKLKDSGIDIALASDFNPGSCNIQSMPFIVALSCIYLKMDIIDAIQSATYIAAKSLMLEDQIGSIEKGKNADIILWGLKTPEQIPYHFLENKVKTVFKKGKVVFTA